MGDDLKCRVYYIASIDVLYCMKYAQANELNRKFSMCSLSAKSTLFKAFCTPMYTSHLWRRYQKSSMQKLIVVYNDGMRLLLKMPR